MFVVTGAFLRSPFVFKLCTSVRRLFPCQPIMISVAYEDTLCRAEGPLTARAFMKRVKADLGIPRAEQALYLDGTPVPPKATLVGDVHLTLLRKPALCGFCGRDGDGSKLRLCSGCLDERYCDEVCQREHWKSHKRVCRS